MLVDRSKVSGVGEMIRRLFCLCFVYIYFKNVLPASVEQSFERDEGTPVGRGKLGRHRLARRSAVEERHSPRHHRPRALRKAQVSEKQRTKERQDSVSRTRSERQGGKLAWILWR